MMGVAAGLAMSKLKPIIYTITPFTTTRCLEQIRVDACYHDVPVIIVGTGSGLSYASLGPTHHSLEDFAIFRAIPNITILAPSDEVELKKCLNEALKLDSPVYMRIGKKGELCKRTHLFYELRPNISITSIPELRTYASTNIQHGIGLKFSLI